MTGQSLRALLREDKLKVGTGFLEFDSPGIGHIAKAAGADYAFVDMEHSGFGIDTIKRVLRYMEAADLPCIVRPLTKDAHNIDQVLDAGADGVLAPMVETADEARAIVEASRYYPQGKRGAALGIAHDRYRSEPMAEAFAAANDRIAVLMLIESAKGVENIEEIAAVPGVDGIWIGAFDLSWSLGVPGEFDTNPKFEAAVSRVLAACKANGLNAGRLVGSPEEGARLHKAGVDAISYSVDIYLLRSALQSGISSIRENVSTDR